MPEDQAPSPTGLPAARMPVAALTRALLSAHRLAAAQAAPAHWLTLFAEWAEDAAVAFRLGQHAQFGAADLEALAEALRDAAQRAPVERSATP